MSAREVIAQAMRETGLTVVSDIGRAADAALAALEAAGYAVVSAPAGRKSPIPKPAAGQRWASPRPRVTPRTVISLETRPSGRTFVAYTTPADNYVTHTPLMHWNSWAKRSGARPVPPTEPQQ